VQFTYKPLQIFVGFEDLDINSMTMRKVKEKYKKKRNDSFKTN
jgi:hypothetical protein